MFSNIFSLFEDSFLKAPLSACLCVPPMKGRDYYPDGFEIDYKTAHSTVKVLQETYTKCGYGNNHRVAVLLENRPEFHLHWLALNGLGISIVPINPDYREDEIIYLLNHSESSLLITIPERFTELVEIKKRCEFEFPVIDVENFHETLHAPKTKSIKIQEELDSEAALLYTSGTTGKPKGCILTNRYFLNSAKWYLEAGGSMALEYGQERLLNPLPMFHANAMAIGSMAMFASAGCIAMLDRFHPKTWWEDVVNSKATIIHYLGIMPPLLLNQKQGLFENSHRVKFGAGAGIDPKHHDLFEKRFGFPLVEGWGMTEVAMPAWASHEPRLIDTRAFGRPLSGCEVRIVDDQDKELASGVPGELTIRMNGKNPRQGLFSGYLKDDDATNHAWRGGWFHTGDTVVQSVDGMLTFVDRSKNIIRRSGENIAAAEVEAFLQSDKRIAQAAVISVPDNLRQEEVMACIILMEGITADTKIAIDIQDRCLIDMAYFKAPAYFLFVDSLPVTNTQKVTKVKIFPENVDPRMVEGCIDLRSRKKKTS